MTLIVHRANSALTTRAQKSYLPWDAMETMIALMDSYVTPLKSVTLPPSARLTVPVLPFVTDNASRL